MKRKDEVYVCACMCALKRQELIEAREKLRPQLEGPMTW